MSEDNKPWRENFRDIKSFWVSQSSVQIEREQKQNEKPSSRQQNPSSSSSSSSRTPRGSASKYHRTVAPPKKVVRDKTARQHLPIQEFYEIGDTLGTGASSVVKKALSKESGLDFAVKIIAKTPAKAEERRMEIIMTEIAILKIVDHKNIVRLEEIFEDATHYFLVMEVISGGELFDRIVALSKYTEKDASRVIRQVLEGIQHLHDHNIAHRDLKPENLLLSSQAEDADLKITDFGLSDLAPIGKVLQMSRAVGTPSYLAPEVLDLLDTGEPYGKEVDLWGVGVILYILLCGFPPFYGEDEEEIYDKIQAGDYDFPSPQWDKISPSAINLIQSLLELDLKKRLTAAQALKHPWMIELAPETPLTETLTELKRFNAKRKFRGAIKAIQAMNRLKAATGGLLGALRAASSKAAADSAASAAAATTPENGANQNVVEVNGGVENPIDDEKSEAVSDQASENGQHVPNPEE